MTNGQRTYLEIWNEQRKVRTGVKTFSDKRKKLWYKGKRKKLWYKGMVEECRDSGWCVEYLSLLPSGKSNSCNLVNTVQQINVLASLSKECNSCHLMVMRDPAPSTGLLQKMTRYLIHRRSCCSEMLQSIITHLKKSGTCVTVLTFQFQFWWMYSF